MVDLDEHCSQRNRAKILEEESTKSTGGDS